MQKRDNILESVSYIAMLAAMIMLGLYQKKIADTLWLSNFFWVLFHLCKGIPRWKPERGWAIFHFVMAALWLLCEIGLLTIWR